MPRPNPTSAPSAPAGAHLPVEQLRRYVAGQLPPAEEHAVEAHTLDCAVCADMLEGLELQPAAAHEASLAALRQRLHTRVAELAPEAAPESAVVPLWAWRPLAAAAVLLISLSVVGWLAVSRFSSAPNIAARTAPKAAARQPTGAPATVQPAEPAAAASDVAVVIPPAAPASPLRRPPAAPMRQRAIVVSDAEVPAPAADLASGSQVSGLGSMMDVAAVAAPDTVESKSVAAAAAPAAAKAKMARVAGVSVTAAPVAPPATRTVQGRITDTSGQPLPGATVLVAGTQTATSTNADGAFSLQVPAAAPQLAVSSVGYVAQTRTLRPSDSTLALALAPDSRQLSEVVVVRREAPPLLPSIGATPAGGYPALRKYLRDSLDYPQKALDERLEGTVRLQFMVGTDGKLSDFKVLRKVSPECDEEAIRLLQAGPAWFPAVQSNRRVARKVVVDVPFKIVQR
ncbi:TonB family protein [Hymenobacter yonginensis]|uniref:TonB family protein n=1 Tax=Hymenobacter yonginensis TaxID=748197 RepID=A0ABY7PPB6_9BACT|nr:TonB family protein [Hymenobacter yonginensis]WBO84038.1 TonB family protein [Hymenobacter yonginensis]